MEGKAAAFVVIAAGSRLDLYECLLSLAESSYTPSRTMVVDNSSNGLTSHLSVAFPRVKVIRPDEPLTFAAAANFGCRTALAGGARLVMLLNDDVTVHPGALAVLADAESKTGPGIFAPEIWPYNTNDQRLRCRIDWKKRLVVREPVAVNGPLTKLDYAEGSALLVSADVFERIGFFDEDLGFYYEDADFSVRAADARFPVFEVEGSRVWHKGSVSAGRGLSPFKAYFRARNTLRFALKHRDRAHVFSNAFYHFTGFVLPQGLRAAAQALAGSPEASAVFSAIVRGTWDLLVGNGRAFPKSPTPDILERIAHLPLARGAC